MAQAIRLRLDVDGARELARALRDLPKRVRRSAIQRALKRAAQPIEREAQERVRVRTGVLASKIEVTTKLSQRQRRRRLRSQGEVAVYVGAEPSRYAHLVEFGTGPRRWRNGKSTGRMPAFPFMRPAWDRNHRRALDVFAGLLWDEIARAAARVRTRR